MLLTSSGLILTIAPLNGWHSIQQQDVKTAKACTHPFIYPGAYTSHT